MITKQCDTLLYINLLSTFNCRIFESPTSEHVISISFIPPLKQNFPSTLKVVRKLFSGSALVRLSSKSPQIIEFVLKMSFLSKVEHSTSF